VLNCPAEHNEEGNKSKGNGKSLADFDVHTNQDGEESNEGEEEFEHNDSWETPPALAGGPSKRASTQTVPIGAKRCCNFGGSKP